MLGPKRGSAAWKRLIKTIYYGIDPTTFEVRSVSLTNDNTLHAYWEKGTYSHHVLSGRQPRNEVVIVWHLVEIIEVMPGFMDTETIKKRVDELREKAVAMKAAAEVKEE